MNRNDSFWLVCDENSHQNCHCDWRVTIVDCIEREPMLYIYIVNAILSFIVSVIGVCVRVFLFRFRMIEWINPYRNEQIGTGLLWHRVVNKKLPIFDFGSPFGYFVRPKPIESMLLFGIIFNLRKYVLIQHKLQLLTLIYSSNCGLRTASHRCGTQCHLKSM